MTKTEKYIDLRKKGMSYAAIGKEFGVTRQAVHCAIHKHIGRSVNVKASTVVFPGLRRWMCENHVFVADLERMTGKSLRHALRNGEVSRKNADAIMKVTHLSYEEAFGNETTNLC